MVLNRLFEANGLGFFGFRFPALRSNLFCHPERSRRDFLKKGFPLHSGLVSKGRTQKSNFKQNYLKKLLIRFQLQRKNHYLC